MSLFKDMKSLESCNKVYKNKQSVISKLVDTYLKLDNIGYSSLRDFKYKEWRHSFYDEVDMATFRVNYTPSDISYLANILVEMEEKTEAVRGIYVGALINFLTVRNPEEVVKVDLDLGEKEFPYLCYFIQNAGVLRISNVVGYDVCNHAFYQGIAKSIELNNVHGDDSGLFIAREGKVDTVYLKNSSGLNFGKLIANKGKAEVILLNGISGNCACSFIGGAIDKGKVGLLSSKDVTGHHCLELILDNIDCYDKLGENAEAVAKLIEVYMNNPSALDLDSKVKELIGKIQGGAR